MTKKELEEHIRAVTMSIVREEMLRAWRGGLGVKLYQAEKERDVLIAFVPLGEDFVTGKN